MNAKKFEAVGIQELVARLGRDCSPDSQKHGYVVGPDITGRPSHVASCRSMTEATAYAEKLNKTVDTLTVNAVII